MDKRTFTRRMRALERAFHADDPAFADLSEQMSIDVGSDEEWDRVTTQIDAWFAAAALKPVLNPTKKETP